VKTSNNNKKERGEKHSNHGAKSEGIQKQMLGFDNQRRRSKWWKFLQDFYFIVSRDIN